MSAITSSVIDLLASASPSPSPSPSSTDFVSKIRGEYGIPETLTWLIITIVVLGAIVIILKNAKDLLESSEKLHGYWQKLVAFYQGDPTRQSLERRTELLKRLRKDVDERISGTLFNQIWMDVQAQEKAEAIESSRLRERPIKPTTPPQPQKWLSRIRRFFKLGNQPQEELEASESTSNVFNRSDGRLLILGDPGSGKTTELLKLAKELIEQAEEDSSKPIPVIFELSAWNNVHQPIAEWLVAQLKETYTIPKALGQQWLQNNQLIPLLDGLDELAVRRGDEVDRSRQISCAVAINDFALGYTKQKLAVCCRQEDYDEGFEQGSIKLDKLKGAVCLQPLSEAQIKKYFDDLKRPQIWQRIRQQSELKEMAKVPLFLGMMVLACQARQITNQGELFDAYLEEQLNKRLDDFKQKDRPKYSRGIHPYPQHATTHYLKVLANKLRAESKTEFLIEKLHPSWLNRSRQKWFYKLFQLLIIEITFGLISIIVFFLILLTNNRFLNALNFQYPTFLINCLKAGLVYGFIFTFRIAWMTDFSEFYGIEMADILPNMLTLKAKSKIAQGLSYFSSGIVESLDIRRIRLWNRFDRLILIGFILLFGMVGGLIGLIVGGAFGLGIGGLVGFAFGGVFGLGIGGLLGGLFVWLMLGLLSGLLFAYEKLSNDLRLYSYANEGVWNSLKTALLVFSVFLLLISIAIANTLENLFALLLISLPVIIWLNGGETCVRHFALRLVLWKSSFIPWNYAKFLDYASDLRFIQRIGGRYRFVHDLLREHFAAMEE